MNEIWTLYVAEEDSGIRLDKYLAGEWTDFSRSYIQKLIEDGRIVCNAQTAKTKDKVCTGDVITATIPEAETAAIVPENIPLDIRYEDDDVCVVYKPAGMVVHPAPGNYTGTLVNALMYHFGDRLSTINGVARPGIVHRIDKDTSGLLMVCKSDRAHRTLAKKLSVHDIEREYRCIVHGNVKEDDGTVHAKIGRDPNDRKKMAVVSDGRDAVTHYRVLERFGELTYLAVRLETGRTHQIRVHMKSLHHPILGDPLYGPANVRGGAKAILNGLPDDWFTKQFLVAKVLGFDHPITGEHLHFECDLTPEFQSVLKRGEEYAKVCPGL